VVTALEGRDRQKLGRRDDALATSAMYAYLEDGADANAWVHPEKWVFFHTTSRGVTDGFRFLPD
jgi:hypothetical protein